MDPSFSKFHLPRQLQQRRGRDWLHSGFTRAHSPNSRELRIEDHRAGQTFRPPTNARSYQRRDCVEASRPVCRASPAFAGPSNGRSLGLLDPQRTVPPLDPDCVLARRQIRCSLQPAFPSHRGATTDHRLSHREFPRPSKDDDEMMESAEHPVKRRRTDFLSTDVEYDREPISVVYDSDNTQNLEEGEIHAFRRGSQHNNRLNRQQDRGAQAPADFHQRTESPTGEPASAASSPRDSDGVTSKIDSDAWTIDSVSLLPTAIDQLGKSGLLDDSVLEFFFRFTHQYILPRSRRDSVFFFNSYFYPKLSEGGTTSEDRHSAVKRWTNRLLTPPSPSLSSVRRFIWEFDVVVVPLNHTGAHWTLALVCFPFLALRKPPSPTVVRLDTRSFTPPPTRSFWDRRGSAAEPETHRLTAPRDFAVPDTSCSTGVPRRVVMAASSSDDSFAESAEPARRKRKSMLDGFNCSLLFRKYIGEATSQQPAHSAAKKVRTRKDELEKSRDGVPRSTCGELLSRSVASPSTRGTSKNSNVEVMNVCSSDEDEQGARTVSGKKRKAQDVETSPSREVPSDHRASFFARLATNEGLSDLVPPGVTQPAIFHLDSLEDTTGPPENLKEYLVDYFQQEFRSRCPEEYGKNFSIASADEWFYVPYLPVPLQENGFDCGIFLIEYLRHLFANRERIKPLLYDAPILDFTSDSAKQENAPVEQLPSESPENVGSPAERTRRRRIIKEKSSNAFKDVGAWIEEFWFSQQHVTHRRTCLQQMLIYMQHHPDWHHRRIAALEDPTPEVETESIRSELLEREFSPGMHGTVIDYLRGLFSCSSLPKRFKRLSRKSLELNCSRGEGSDADGIGTETQSERQPQEVSPLTRRCSLVSSTDRNGAASQSPCRGEAQRDHRRLVGMLASAMEDVEEPSSRNTDRRESPSMRGQSITKKLSIFERLGRLQQSATALNSVDDKIHPSYDERHYKEEYKHHGQRSRERETGSSTSTLESGYRDWNNRRGSYKEEQAPTETRHKRSGATRSASSDKSVVTNRRSRTQQHQPRHSREESSHRLADGRGRENARYKESVSIGERDRYRTTSREKERCRWSSDALEREKHDRRRAPVCSPVQSASSRDSKTSGDQQKKRRLRRRDSTQLLSFKDELVSD